MGRFFKVLLGLVLAAEWYTRGGKEILFGAPIPRDGDARELRRIRQTMMVSPNLGTTFTDVAAKRVAGTSVVTPDGETIGSILTAERFGDGWLRVQYDVDRSQLGYPVVVAVGQAEQYVAEAARKRASKL